MGAAIAIGVNYVYASSAEKELGEALKNSTGAIMIEGDLAKKVIRIRAVGNVAWLAAAGAIISHVAAVLLAAPSRGTSSAGFIAWPATISILDAGGMMTAIGIAVAAGGVAALNRVRRCREAS